MKEEKFLEELNNGNENSIWKLEENINNGYPVLYWQ